MTAYRRMEMQEMDMQKRSIVAIVVMASNAACGGLCPPWGNSSECEFYEEPNEGDTGDVEPPPPLPEHPCKQLGDAVGIPLVHHSPAAYPAWHNALVIRIMSWAQNFPSRWEWPDGAPLLGSAAVLRGVDGYLVLGEGLSQNMYNQGAWQWIQVEGAVNVSIAGVIPHRLPQSDGSEILGVHLGVGSYWWDLTGEDVAVRGWAAGAGRLAGPDQSNVQITSNGSKAWTPAHGFCVVDTTPEPDPDPEGGSGGGTTGPEPEPEMPENPPGTFDPCIELGYSTTVIPEGYSPAWLKTDAEIATMHRFYLAMEQLLWAWAGGSPDHDGQPAELWGWSTVIVDPAPEGAAIGWALVYDAYTELVPQVQRDTASAVSQDANAVQLEDGSWLVWVEGPAAGAAVWTSGLEGSHRLRGWARADQPGVPVTQDGMGPVPSVSGGGTAFMPAIGYCIPSGPEPEPEPLDESGGG
jgi:hypothetical protein